MVRRLVPTRRLSGGHLTLQNIVGIAMIKGYAIAMAQKLDPDTSPRMQRVRVTWWDDSCASPP
jgi:hypothetical protein